MRIATLTFIVMSRFDIDFGVLPDMLSECALLLWTINVIWLDVTSDRRSCEREV